MIIEAKPMLVGVLDIRDKCQEKYMKTKNSSEAKAYKEIMEELDKLIALHTKID